MIILKLLLFFISIIITGFLIEKLFIKNRESFLFKLTLAWDIGSSLIKNFFNPGADSSGSNRDIL
jgi:hypothetical protein